MLHIIEPDILKLAVKDKERTYLSYVWDYHNALLKAHNEDPMACRGIIQHEVGK